MAVLAASLAALLATIVAMFMLRPVAIATGLVDIPGGRKSHAGMVPLIGGLAMYLGILTGFSFLPESIPIEMYFLGACGLLLIVGVFDDMRRVNPRVRLCAQVFVTCVMVYGGGVIISDIGNPLGLGTIYLGPLALPFTGLVACTVINAFNFVDGVDGLAACLSIIAIGAVILVAGSLVSSTAAIGLVVCMSVLGFLVFNFPSRWNAKIQSFMGDAGSTMLGLVVVWLTTTVSQGEARTITPVVGLWFAVVPLSDFFTAFGRRLLRGASPMQPDSAHFHHILLGHGLSPRAVLNIIASLGLFYAAIGIAMHYYGVSDPVMFASWSCVMVAQHGLVVLIGRIHQRWQLSFLKSELVETSQRSNSFFVDKE